MRAAVTARNNSMHRTEWSSLLGFLRMFSALSCTALSHGHGSRSISAAHLLTQVSQAEGDRTQLYDRALAKSLVRFPHCAAAQTHLHLTLLTFAHKGHHRIARSTRVGACAVALTHKQRAAANSHCLVRSRTKKRPVHCVKRLVRGSW